MFVVVGVSGGIAAYKTVSLVRSLVTNGHEVHVVPTVDALRFVGTATWEAVSRHPVTTSVHDDVADVRHVSLGTRADLVIVAPATAHTLARMAAGLADDLLTVTLLATTAPVLVAPAMHTAMWEHAATRASMATLRDRGMHVIGPDDGPLTGGDSGPGRMAEPEAILAAAERLISAGPVDAAAASGGGDLAGWTVAVSTGGTREPIDPVRYLGNRSSGRQGVAVARAAADRGAQVRLVAAHVDEGVLADVERHPRVSVTRAGTAAELHDAMREAASDADVVVMVAAVGDFRAAEVSAAKLRKEDGDGTLSISLVQNPDILADLAAARPDGQLVVGFAAETVADDAELIDRARRKRERKGVDLIVANRVDGGRGFEGDRNEVVMVDADGAVGGAVGTKRAVAESLWDAALTLRRS